MAPCYGWRSPHTRGARGQALRRLGPRRIIPAYAGSTYITPPPFSTSPDHPRIRGEHVRSGILRCRCRRIIPAYAGSTRPRSPASAARADHPRIRGEHSCTRALMPAIVGSSPHTRGAQMRVEGENHQTGIIPAYAGSTSATRTSAPTRPDHPRIRGEHGRNPGVPEASAGSSPHTRGALDDSDQYVIDGRIIPAYAGSTPEHGDRVHGFEDHPRIRGEHETAVTPSWKTSGSSPHTRGARSCCVATGRILGIIPAYAGSTTGPHRSGRRSPDHPRIRGEHVRRDR